MKANSHMSNILVDYIQGITMSYYPNPADFNIAQVENQSGNETKDFTSYNSYIR